MGLKIAINGFGRIGRNVFRCLLKDEACGDVEITAINDLTDAATLAHLLKYDSVQGVLDLPVSSDGSNLIVNGKRIQVLSERDPANLPWKEMGVDIVIESTGFFTKREGATKHLSAGAKKVIISAPASDPDVTIVLGVNSGSYDAKKHHIISNASCTTNCLAPVAKILNDEFGIERGLMTTVHSYTNDQSILDLPHKDLRRARAAAVSMIPTTTGAAKAVSLVLPELKGKLDGMAIRVPTPNVSLIDLVVELKSETTVGAVNKAFRTASDGAYKGILRIEDAPLVSSDYNGDPTSSIVDSLSTKIMGGSMLKVLSWYDNEWGYSSRVKDLVKFIAEKGI